MRVIAGSLKGRPLADPGKGVMDIRPTSDMAREALFSILGKWPQGPFLDLFAGTAAVAVEAWSRGYAPVIAVERAPHALGLAHQNARGTEVRILRRDIQSLGMDAFKDVAVLFADPPYRGSMAWWVDLAPRMAAWMHPEGVVVWESESRDAMPELPGWEKADERRYGRAKLHFMCLRTPHPSPEA